MSIKNNLGLTALDHSPIDNPTWTKSGIHLVLGFPTETENGPHHAERNSRSAEYPLGDKCKLTLFPFPLPLACTMPSHSHGLRFRRSVVRSIPNHSLPQNPPSTSRSAVSDFQSASANPEWRSVTWTSPAVKSASEAQISAATRARVTAV